MGKSTRVVSPWATIEVDMSGAEQQAYEQEQAGILSVAHRAGEFYVALKQAGVPSKVAGRIVENYCMVLFMPDDDAGDEVGA